jgi:hypothetical protein
MLISQLIVMMQQREYPFNGKVVGALVRGGLLIREGRYRVRVAEQEAA